MLEKGDNVFTLFRPATIVTLGRWWEYVPARSAFGFQSRFVKARDTSIVDMVSLANDSHDCDIWFLILQRGAASYQLI